MDTKHIMYIGENSYYKDELSDSFNKNLSLYVSFYGEFYAKKGYSTKRRGHKTHLLIYTIEGEGEMIYGNETYSLTKDSFILINCDNFQHYKTKDDYWHFFHIHIDNDRVEDIIKSMFNSDALYLPRVNDDIITRYFTEIMYKQLFDSKLQAINNSQLAFNILSLVYKIYNHENSVRYDTIYIKIDKYIQENFLTKISLDDLCFKFGVSKYHFIRVFKKYKNLSPYDYIICLRLNHAKQLLASPDKSIDEIAFITNYDSATSFIRAFKKANGITPSALRKELFSSLFINQAE